MTLREVVFVFQMTKMLDSVCNGLNSIKLEHETHFFYSTSTKWNLKNAHQACFVLFYVILWMCLSFISNNTMQHYHILYIKFSCIFICKFVPSTTGAASIFRCPTQVHMRISARCLLKISWSGKHLLCTNICRTYFRFTYILNHKHLKDI